MNSPAAFILAATLAPLAADQVRMTDGGQLGGRILALDEQSLSLKTPLAPDTVRLRTESIQSVSFEIPEASRPEHDARVVLINGDRLPCDLISINQEHVRVSTRYTGALDIRRSDISSLQLGIRPREVLYQGPVDADDWQVANEWHLEEGRLVSSGKGSVSRRIEKLPDSFSIQFEIAWNQQPNLEFYFCSSETRSGGGKLDRYYLQFGSAGFAIQRQSSGETTYQSLGDAPMLPDSFSDSKATVEIRVDRRIKRIELLIDGEFVGRFNDPLPAPPEGDILIFSSNAQAAETHRVGNIAVRSWSASRDRHDSEDRGEADGDSIIDNSGQRFTGELTGTRGEGADAVFLFKSPHLPEPLEIPATAASTLFFAKPDPKAARPPMIIGLHEHGLLSVASCTFSGEAIRLTHPLLGEFELNRSALTSMTRRQNAKATEP